MIREKKKMIVFVALLCVCFLLNLTGYSATDEKAGLVAHYTFDEGGGSVITDYSGHDYHSIKNRGVKYVPSPRGNALQFSGSGSFVNFGNPPGMNLAGDITLAVWIKVDATKDNPKKHRVIFGHQANISIKRNYNFVIDKHQKLRFEWGDGENYGVLVTNAKFLDGTWKHLVVVCDSKNRQAVLYCDGVVIARKKMPVPITKSSGFYRCAGGGSFKGEIDDIRLYNRALSEVEVKRLYEAKGSPGIAAISVVKPDTTKLKAKANSSKLNGLVGDWDFNEGKGNTLRDRSGNGNDGTITGAKWVKVGKGYALEFKGPKDRVDCGNGPSLDLRDAATIAVWVLKKHSPSTRHGNIVGKGHDSFLLTDGKHRGLNWFISHENYPKNNYMSCQAPSDEWMHIVATFGKGRMYIYHNGVQRRVKRSLFPTINKSDKLYIGGGKFHGLIGAVRVYNRALNQAEAQRLYVGSVAKYESDFSWIGRLQVKPYIYFADNRIMASVSYKGLWPVAKGSRIHAKIMTAGKTPTGRVNGYTLRACRAETEVLSNDHEVELSLPAPIMPVAPVGSPDEYILRVELINQAGERTATEDVKFRYPPAVIEIPAPAKWTVAALPPLLKTVKYGFKINAGGGFDVVVNGKKLPFESTFSYPGGGENRLARGGKNGWQVKTRKVSNTEYVVTGKGRNYTLERHIKLSEGRIRVRDRFRNPTDKDVGIIIRNHLNTRGLGFEHVYRAGYEGPGILAHGSMFSNIFTTRKGLGVGMVTLDDVYSQQSELYSEKGRTGIATRSFGLAAGASYDMKWAIYLTPTQDRYDFVNVVRQGEGINGRVDTNYNFMVDPPRGGWYATRRMVPSKEWVKMAGINVAGHHGMMGVADDPGIVLAGFDYVKWPLERALLRRQFNEARRLNPGLKTVLHVATGIYTTDKPEEFQDSRCIDKDGKQFIYSITNTKYMSQARLDDGWKAWGFYPRIGNSYHKALMDSVDVLMDEIGADGIFFDAAITGPVTYDTWDGHSVEIDPKTKKIIRKYALVNLINREAIQEYLHKIQAKGGVIIHAPPHHGLVGQKGINWCAELSVGPSVHFTPTPVVLGCEVRPQKEKDNIKAIHHNLKWGALTYWYVMKDLTQDSIWQQMFPITFDEIRPGYVRGRERLVTINSGVYGWRDDNRLHFSYHYDDRGMLTSKKFLTTADQTGVRTEVVLDAGESAILKKIPLRIQSKSPVNVVVHGYAPQGVNLTINGKGDTSLEIRDGEFPIRAGDSYRVRAIGKDAFKVTADKDARLTFVLDVAGKTEVTISRLP